MHHVFISSTIASKILIYFDNIFKVNHFCDNISIRDILNLWFISLNGNIRNIIPPLLLCNIWFARNNSFLNNVVIDHNHIIRNIKDNILNLFNANLLTVKIFRCYLFGAKKLGLFLNICMLMMIPKPFIGINHFITLLNSIVMGLSKIMFMSVVASIEFCG